LILLSRIQTYEQDDSTKNPNFVWGYRSEDGKDDIYLPLEGLHDSVDAVFDPDITLATAENQIRQILGFNDQTETSSVDSHILFFCDAATPMVAESTQAQSKVRFHYTNGYLKPLVTSANWLICSGLSGWRCHVSMTSYVSKAIGERTHLSPVLAFNIT
jgi:hypothetical protein